MAYWSYWTWLYIRLTRRVSYKKQKLLKRSKHLGSRFVVGSELLVVLVFCVVVCFYVLFVFVLCLVCPILPVSLDCPFLITPSVFSNDYLNFRQNKRWLEFLKNFTSVDIFLSITENQLTQQYTYKNRGSIRDATAELQVKIIWSCFINK